MSDEMKLSEIELIMILEAWDRVSAAIDRVVTSLPSQMTDASTRLEHERQYMRTVINAATRSAISPKSNP